MTRIDDAGRRPLAAAGIVSSTPGRVRLRVTARGADPDRLAAATDAVGGRAEVTRAEPRWRTGSLLVEYDPAHAEAAWAALAELGLEHPAPVTTAADGTEPEARVVNALTRANGLVAGRTGGTDLRVLLPVGLGMLALRQVVRDDQRLGDAPWYVLAWYASETFQRFHTQRRRA